MRNTRSAMAVFASVLEKRSLASAAREFDLTPSAVSRIITRLEERLSVRLIQRNTRHLVPTEAGATYHAWCRHILRDIAEAEAALDQVRTAPAGWLRLRAPEVFGRERIGTLLPDLMARYPEMQVELVLTGVQPDPNQDGSDLGFRIGALANSQLIVRRLCMIRSVLVAAPGYLSERRAPSDPSDLADHRLVAFPRRAGAPVWLLRDRAGRTVPVVEPLRLACNAVDGIARMVQDGAGVGLLPTYLAGPEIEAGRLTGVRPAGRVLRTPSRRLGIIGLAQCVPDLGPAAPPGRTRDGISEKVQDGNRGSSSAPPPMPRGMGFHPHPVIPQDHGMGRPASRPALPEGRQGTGCRAPESHRAVMARAPSTARSPETPPVSAGLVRGQEPKRHTTDRQPHLGAVELTR